MSREKWLPIMWLFLVTLLAAVTVLAWQPAPGRADTPLPDRHPPTPARPAGGNNRDSSGAAGASIELQMPNPPAGAWSVVEWQDTNGDWHKVEGWQGTLENGVQRWWVHPREFGKGPFRWVIYGSAGGPLLTITGPFTLPQFPNETVRMHAGL